MKDAQRKGQTETERQRWKESMAEEGSWPAVSIV